MGIGKSQEWDFPGGPVIKILHFYCSGAQVPSLIREIILHMLCGMAKKKKVTRLTWSFHPLSLTKSFQSRPNTGTRVQHLRVRRDPEDDPDQAPPYRCGKSCSERQPHLQWSYSKSGADHPQGPRPPSSHPPAHSPLYTASPPKPKGCTWMPQTSEDN